MNKSLNVNSISVENFRGIGEKRTLDFDNLTVIFGENGSGKSSFVNAFEYLFTNELGHLNRKPIDQDKVIPHKGYSKSDINIKLSLTGGDLELSDGRLEYTNDVYNSLNDYVKQGNFILNRRRLLKFIKGTQGERYKELVEFCGLTSVKKQQSILSTTKKNLNKELSVVENNLKELLNELSNILADKNNLTYDDSLDILNNLLKDNDLEAVTKETDFKTYLNSLNLVEDNVLVKEKITKFNNIFLEINIEILKENLDRIIEEYQNLASNNLKTSNYLLKTLKSSQLFFENSDSNTCPVCNSPVDMSTILPKLKQNIDDLNLNNNQFKDWKDNVNDLISDFASLNQKLAKLDHYIVEINQFTNNQFNKSFEPIINEFANLSEDLKELSEFNLTISKLEDYNFNKLNESICTLKSEFDDEFSDYDIGDNITKIFNSLTILNEISKTESKIKVLRKKANAAELTFNLYIKAQEEFINKIFKEISDDIFEFYNYIHEGDYLIDPTMVLCESNAVDILLNSFGEDIDARSVSSEGHIDSLGLVIFLALNKRFNNLPFIILDDVISTVDFSHKNNIARLFTEKLGEYQFFITTHNSLWADHLNRIGASRGKSVKVYEIINWDKDEGPVLATPKDPESRINKYLSIEDRDLYAAGNAARRYLEYILKEICLANEIKVPFKKVYDVGSLFDHTKNFCIEKVENTDMEDEHNRVWDILTQTKGDSNLLSHDNILSADLTYDDVKQFCDAVIDLNKLYTCDKHSKEYLVLLSDKMYCPKCFHSYPYDGEPVVSLTPKNFGEEQLNLSAEYVVNYLAGHNRKIDMKTAKILVPAIGSKDIRTFDDLNDFIRSVRFIHESKLKEVFKEQYDVKYDKIKDDKVYKKMCFDNPDLEELLKDPNFELSDDKFEKVKSEMALNQTLRIKSIKNRLFDFDEEYKFYLDTDSKIDEFKIY